MECLGTTRPKARLPHKCFGCYGVIKAGERHLCEAWTDGGQAYSIRYCQTCEAKIPVLMQDTDLQDYAQSDGLPEGWVTTEEMERAR